MTSTTSAFWHSDLRSRCRLTGIRTAGLCLSTVSGHSIWRMLHIPYRRFGGHATDSLPYFTPFEVPSKRTDREMPLGSLRYLCKLDCREQRLCHTAFATDPMVPLGRTCGVVQAACLQVRVPWRLFELHGVCAMRHSPGHGWCFSTRLIYVADFG